MRGFRIGSVFGIDLRVDRSWLVIFVLLTWSLTSMFTGWHPGWSTSGALALALMASLLFFGCVLLHELAHAAVAAAYGLRVRTITLFLFGGVSNIEEEPPSPRAEFFTAIVGPVASIVIGAFFLLLAAIVAPMISVDGERALSLDIAARLGPFVTLLVWLGPINILIGLFNMIPAFPLDGGRVLRAALWSASHDVRAATRWASATGQTIGWLMIGAGIAMTFGARIPLFGSGLVSGLWLALIGWFLHGAAAQATARLALDDAVAGLSVEQLMQRHGTVAAPDASVASLVEQQLRGSDDRALPVVEGPTLVGLVSISDVRKLRPETWQATPVRAIMRPVSELKVAAPTDPLGPAFEALLRQDIEQLPVVFDGQLVGMLRRRDVSRWLELTWRPSADTTAVAPPQHAWHDPRPHHA